MTRKTGIDRRGVLKGAAVAGVGLATPTLLTARAYANDYLNAPSGSTVTLGLNIPQTGPYAEEGADQLRAQQLAIKHLNGEGDGGMLNTMQPNSLKGNGILGRKVEYVTGDTQTNTDAARASARRMIERDGAIMITGGSSSGPAVAVQALCHEVGIIFMAGLTHSNDTTGKDKRANGFRHFFNSEMTGRAIAPILADNYGTDRVAYHLTADYNWGWTTRDAMTQYTEALGWETAASVLTPLGSGDFSQYITPVLNSDADVLILNHYGGDMVNSLTQAVQFGLRDRTVNGKQFEIVVPLFSRLMAQGAGEACRGIFGTSNWHWSLQDEASQAFVRSFGQEYGFPPSQAAHTCYVQILQYADACERAGTHAPCGVVEALKDHEFDGTGDGPALYRGGDHQVFKRVLVVKGKENPTSNFDLLEIVDQTPTEQITYDVGIFGGELGQCNNGV